MSEALSYRTFGILSVAVQAAVAERRRHALNMPPLCGPRPAAGRLKRWDAVVAHQVTEAHEGDPISDEADTDEE